METDLTKTGLTRPAKQFGYAIFITIYYVQVKLFLIKLIVFHELYGGDSVSLRLGVAKIGS